VITRRELLLSGMAWPLLPGLAMASESVGGARPVRIVVDGSTAAGRSFARRAAALTATPLVDIEGNAAQLWSAELYHSWRFAPEPIAGLTGHSAWFLLDLMARGAGLRTVYRGEHRAAAEGGMRHRLAGSFPARAANALRLAQTDDWQGVLAKLLSEFRVGAQQPGSGTDALRAARQRTVAPDTLVSWVIADPRTARTAT
jgi:hypothetical protein